MERMFRSWIPLAVLMSSQWPLRSPLKMVFLYERGSHGKSPFWSLDGAVPYGHKAETLQELA